MKFENEDFAYYIEPNTNREAIIGLKKFFINDINILNKENGIPFTSKFMQSSIIGTLVFEMLRMNNIEFSNETKKNIYYFNYYLDKCISDSSYCNNSVFLSFMSYCLGISLPKKDIILKNYLKMDELKNYNVIHAPIEEKLEIIHNNKSEIIYNKIYFCHSIEDLFIASLFELFERKYVIRKCLNCHKFFVTKEKGKRVKYCYNISPNSHTKTCYEEKSIETSTNNRRDDIRINLYDKITKRIRNRKERTDDQKLKELYQEKLWKLRDNLDDFKKEIKNNNKTEDELIDYLIKYDKEDIENFNNTRRKHNGSSRNNKK